MRMQLLAVRMGLLFQAVLTAHSTGFVDNFDDSSLDRSKWATITRANGSSVETTDGLLVLKNRGTVVTDAEFDSFDVRGRFRFTGQPSDRFVVFIRTSGSSENEFSDLDDGLVIRFQRDIAKVGIDEWNHPNNRTLAETDADLSMNTWLDFRIHDDGSQVVVYFNDLETPLLSVPTFFRPGAKLAMNNGLFDHTVEIDYIEIDQIHTENFANGLVAYYPLNGDAKDATGHGHDGTLSGVISSEDRFGTAGQSMEFFGSSASFVRVPHRNGLFSPTEISISAWVYVEPEGSNNPRIFSKGWGVNALEGSLQRVPDEVFNSPRLNNNLNRNGYWVNARTSLNMKQWYSIVFVDDGNQESIYINGKLDNTFVHNRNLVPRTSTDLFFGKNSENASDYYAGKMDDIRIYNRALNASEITALYDYEIVNDPSFVPPAVDPGFPLIAERLSMLRGYVFTLMGDNDAIYRVEESENLEDWTWLITVRSDGTPITLIDEPAMNAAFKFYRAKRIR